MRRVLSRLRDSLAQTPRIRNRIPIHTLGSPNGQKTICPLIKPNFVISGGAGTDISWELELMQNFSTKIFLVDPTHLSRALVENLTKTQKFLQLKKELSALSFFPFALWDELTTLPMYPPTAIEQNDYSLVGLQKTKGMSGYEPIKVQTITIPKLLEEQRGINIDILKLDIEGAEFKVLKNLFRERIFPEQILIEVDELFFPSIRNIFRARKVFAILRKNGYVCFYRRYFDFSYIKGTTLLDFDLSD